MPFLSLGGSIGTPKEGIKSEIFVVKSFDELEKNSSKANGKVVIFNIPFINYGQAVQYRVNGAKAAAQAGAVASLIRSVTPDQTQIPHAGVMYYSDTIPKIFHGAISPEDAQMLQRMTDWGLNPTLHIYSEAQTLPDALSHNLMGELKGKLKPEVILAIGGHSDSWDAGTGAHDDASGCIVAWEAVRLLKKLGLRPKRTIRAVMWVNEENGLRGGTAYANKHKDEPHFLAFEFDSGLFPPSEIRYTGPDSLFDIVKSYEPLLKKIDNIEVIKGGGGVDISPLMKQGVNAMSLNTHDEGKYFWYHHSDKDTMDKIDPMDLNKCIAAVALAIYIYADLP